MQTTVTTMSSFQYTVKKKVILTSFQLPTVMTWPPPGKQQIQSSRLTQPEDALLPDVQESTGRIPTNFDKKMVAGKRSVLVLLCTILFRCHFVS